MVTAMVRFRPNVAALMIRPTHDQLLICERSSIPGAWQFPQGGVDAGESLEEALFREVREEIGLLPDQYDVVRMLDGYRYLYPEAVREKKVRKHGFHGQAQTYFLCHLKEGSEEKINVDQKPREFSNYRWIDPEEFDLDWLPAFKHEVYKLVMKDFFKVNL